MVSVDDESAGPLELRVLTEVNSKKKVSIESCGDALHYMRIAMRASASDASPRGRPSHTERLNSFTGVKGVYAVKDGSSHTRLLFRFDDEDGRTRRKRVKCEPTRGADELQSLCKRLRCEPHNETEANNDADLAQGDAPADTVESLPPPKKRPAWMSLFYR